MPKVDGLRARGKRKFEATTNSCRGFPVAPNRLERRSTGAASKRVWAADIAAVRTAEGWLALAIVVDMFGRRMAGFAMRERVHLFDGSFRTDVSDDGVFCVHALLPLGDELR